MTQPPNLVDPLVDQHLGVSPIARKVIDALRADTIETEPHGDSLLVHTFALYNGRSKGVCLRVLSIFNDNIALHVFWANQRSGDGLIAWAWTTKALPYEAPTCVGADAEEVNFAVRESEDSAVAACAAFVRERVRWFLAREDR